MDVVGLQKLLREFTQQRDWERYHSPKNLTMALAVEASELMEIFQWVGAEESRNAINQEETMDRVKEELADVLAYALRLADVLEIDLEAAVRTKVEMNAKKYPPGERRTWTMK